MEKNVKVIGGLSRKTKINIFIIVFIVFLLAMVLSSINQITNIIKNREKLFELEQKLNWDRQNNIKLLAQEKSLYKVETIESEARKQFNMTKGYETNYFVEIVNDIKSGTGISDGSIKNTDNGSSQGKLPNKVYSDSALWENLKIFYDSEIR
ncbi:MAG TPA: septum formation initiator family protein [Candidatus Humimicrobiaceae bacterium]